MSRAHPIVFVRPYSTRIRTVVTKLVVEAGCTLVGVIEEGTPDKEAVTRSIAFDTHALNVPFHAHRSRSGEALDGFSFLRALHAEAAEFKWRILMPVSDFAIAAVELQRDELPPELLNAVMFLYERDLAKPENAKQIANHLGIRR